MTLIVEKKHELVFNNMLKSSRPLAVLILASREILNKNVDDMIRELNLCNFYTKCRN